MIAPLLVNHASNDPRFQNHPGLRRYGIESYIAVPLNRRDGSYFGTLCALDPVPANLGEEDFAILNLLAQLIAFELEADEQQRAREADLRSLEDFIAIAAHDLRQPLTALYGRAQLLARRARQGGSAESLIPGIETLVVQTRRSVQLSENLLDIARLETGEFQLKRERFNLVTLAQQAVDDAQMNAPAHTFIFEAPPQLTFYGDASRLGQVLRNLLDNAAKYTPADRGAVEFNLFEKQVDGEPGVVQITVLDAGIGVSEDELPHLFERRFRAANAAASSISGTGLGLYITRQIVEAHGGTIRAERGPIAGLAIQIVLPQAE